MMKEEIYVTMMSTKCKLKIIDGAKPYIKERGETRLCRGLTAVLHIFKTHAVMV